MCSPDGPPLVLRFDFQALASEELHRAAQNLAEGKQYGIFSRMDAETALSIADREPPGRYHRTTNKEKPGRALRLRLHPAEDRLSLHRNVETRKIASLHEAAVTVDQFCQRNRAIGGKVQNVTRYIWRKYRSVSHLWAAWCIMLEFGFMDRTIPEWFPIFCGTAQWLLEEGAAITQRGRRHGETVLSLDEAWCLPASRIPRSADGAILNRVWIDDPDAHDLRNKTWQPARKEE